jgi:hypothetical protein
MIFLSAGGRNADILSSFRSALLYEPRHLIVVCLSHESPLATLASSHRHVRTVCFNPPYGKDGFLSSNALLALAVLLTRAYEQAFNKTDTLPISFVDLINSHSVFTALGDLPVDIFSRESLLVLHGAASAPAAIDLESKFGETGLGHVQVCDYRNFAHGRHVWLTRRPSTAVTALLTSEDRDLAHRTLRLLPRDVPVGIVDIPHDGDAATLAALAYALGLVAVAGHAQGIDPGRPNVPLFGRRIYNLRALPWRIASPPDVSPQENAAIKRKADAAVLTLLQRGQLDAWRVALSAFATRLTSVSFRAVVFDYDGTLCDNRFTGIDSSIRDPLLRLLHAGVHLGIATGRGKSVKTDLRRCIPEAHWGRILIGYYNGSDIAPLADDSRPVPGPLIDTLSPIADAIDRDLTLAPSILCQQRCMQISVEAAVSLPPRHLWQRLHEIACGFGPPSVTVVQSTHSVDILAPGVSKRSLVRELHKRLPDEHSSILCIGDRGRWPGNDFALLAEPYSLSVDETSLDPSTCWNLAPPGYRGVTALRYYLQRLLQTDGSRLVVRNIDALRRA